MVGCITWGMLLHSFQWKALAYPGHDAPTLRLYSVFSYGDEEGEQGYKAKSKNSHGRHHQHQHHDTE